MNSRPRARALGVPFDGRPGTLNAITDVDGVEVGFCTLSGDEGLPPPNRSAIRTGVTAILPRGRARIDRCFAAWFSLNGNGEMTGTTWIEESGCLEGPVLITNTHSVGVVRDTAIRWMRKHAAPPEWCLPVVAETYDGFLNDINGFHVLPDHVFKALDEACGGPVTEGNVGGGTGMTLYQFKGGTGSASRVAAAGGDYTVGVLVQANYGRREQLRVAGVPIGQEITDLMPVAGADAPVRDPGAGSIIVVVATDAPLLPIQLKGLVKRAALGLARNGSIAEHSSGDIFVAFSTANQVPHRDAGTGRIEMLANEWLTPLFGAVTEATEEAVVNALVAAETTIGFNGNTAYAVPTDRLCSILARHGRLDTSIAS